MNTSVFMLEPIILMSCKYIYMYKCVLRETNVLLSIFIFMSIVHMFMRINKDYIIHIKANNDNQY